MKRRITLFAALVLCVMTLSLASSDAMAQTPNRLRVVADTGVITLGLNQKLVLSITFDPRDGNDEAIVRFKRTGYIEQGNVYKVISEVTTDPIRLMPGEAASIDISQGQFNAVRGVILVRGLTKDMTGTLQIIDRATGQVNSILIALLVP